MSDESGGPLPDGVDPRSPFALLGGEAKVREIARRFYDHMACEEPALARLHPCDAEGRVSQESQDRFALFLVGWLGGPQTYMERHGHPRLRMRHGRVPVNVAMRDAWMRSMRAALDESAVTGGVRTFLETKLADLADFLRNSPG
jgi:hemoglobin